MRYRIDAVTSPAERAMSASEEAAGANAKELEEALHRRLAKAFGRRRADVGAEEPELLRWSLDVRDKAHPKVVRSIAFTAREGLDLAPYKEEEYRLPLPARLPEEPPVVVGFGPCGLFAALLLAEAGLCPLVLERGRPVEERIAHVERYWRGGRLDPESNVQFGEGGAGTFSDGKLTTGVRDPRIGKIFDAFIVCGADPRIRLLKKPHIGTDRLREIVPRLREKIESLGGRVLFGARFTGLEVKEGRVAGVRLADGRRLPASAVVLALGHSARDSYAALLEQGVKMEPKAFSIGARIEHSQALIDRAMYGEGEALLRRLAGPAEYKLATRAGGRGVYTFCMCPGGEIVLSASEEGQIVTNGMSDAARSGEFANSALLTDVRRDDLAAFDTAKSETDMAAWMKNLGDSDCRGILAGAFFQEHYERLAYELGRGQAPSCRYGDFGDSAVAASLPPWAATNLMEAMPQFGRKIHGFDDGAARFVGVETRSSSPVRILRDESLQAPGFLGLYPAGEGAGFAGGITSAALDGIRVAEAILTCGILNGSV